MRKVIQMTCTQELLYALMDDNTIHRYDPNMGCWILVPPVPHSYAEKMEELESQMDYMANIEEDEDDDS